MMLHLNRKWILAISIALNLALVSFVGYKVSVRVKPSGPPSYLDNYQFKEQTAIFDAYTATCDVAIIGDSHVYKVHWDELLGMKVCNRGIGSDIVKGMYMRISHVIQNRPKTCFILGGANDVEALTYSPDSTFYYFRLIIDTLQAHNIQPVIMQPMTVGPGYPNEKEVNKRIRDLAQKLHSLDAPIIAINLSTDDLQPDLIHLKASGYKKWKDAILKHLSTTPLVSSRH